MPLDFLRLPATKVSLHDMSHKSIKNYIRLLTEVVFIMSLPYCTGFCPLEMTLFAMCNFMRKSSQTGLISFVKITHDALWEFSFEHHFMK